MAVFVVVLGVLAVSSVALYLQDLAVSFVVLVL